MVKENKKGLWICECTIPYRSGEEKRCSFEPDWALQDKEVMEKIENIHKEAHEEYKVFKKWEERRLISASNIYFASKVNEK